MVAAALGDAESRFLSDEYAFVCATAPMNSQAPGMSSRAANCPGVHAAFSRKSLLAPGTASTVAISCLGAGRSSADGDAEADADPGTGLLTRSPSAEQLGTGLLTSLPRRRRLALFPPTVDDPDAVVAESLPAFDLAVNPGPGPRQSVPGAHVTIDGSIAPRVAGIKTLPCDSSPRSRAPLPVPRRCGAGESNVTDRGRWSLMLSDKTE